MLKCTHVQMRSKHVKVADGRHLPTKCAKAGLGCAAAGLISDALLGTPPAKLT